VPVQNQNEILTVPFPTTSKGRDYMATLINRRNESFGLAEQWQAKEPAHYADAGTAAASAPAASELTLTAFVTTPASAHGNTACRVGSGHFCCESGAG